MTVRARQAAKEALARHRASGKLIQCVLKHPDAIRELAHWQGIHGSVRAVIEAAMLGTLGQVPPKK
jgi:hypothetical protein